MTMRSEGEIRREVEARLRRRGLLIADGGLLLLVGFGLYEYSRYYSFPFSEPWPTVIVLFLLFWGALLGLHTLAVLYVEIREWLVQRAITKERQFYVLQESYEKRKRDQALPSLTDDGELIDFPDEEAEERDYAQRSRNS